MAAIDFRNIRSNEKGQRDCFESLTVQLFHANFKAPSGSSFFSLRGDGGDGGVEAYFDTPTGKVGIQAKYFFTLGSSEFNQIKGSLATALANHPTLTEYVIYIPFDLTGPVASGKRGLSEVERFEAWRLTEQKNAAAAGKTLAITLCSAAAIISQINALDKHGGMRRYWFDAQPLTTAHVGQLLNEAERHAGPRYMAALDIATTAHRGLDFFGGTGDYSSWYKETIKPSIEVVRKFRNEKKATLEVLTAEENHSATRLLRSIEHSLSSLEENTEGIAELISGEIATVVSFLEAALDIHKQKFDELYGSEKDSITFRQFYAEFMVEFPAADMDSLREFIANILQVQEDLASVECRAGTVQSLLLRGPAGIGKTHAIVSSALRRYSKGGMSLISFGDDFEIGEPWEVLRSKVGFGSNVSRDELYECFQACADHSGLPFVIYIDALNEIVNKRRWRKNLPQLLEQLKPYPGIKLVVSARDIYLEKVVDKKFPGLAFEHAGFSGQEYQALEGFAAHYRLDKEITPLFSKELNNPLFLHLACKAFVREEHRTLDMALPGFRWLVESYLEECNEKIRDRIDYLNVKNLTRDCMLVLAKTLVDAMPRNRTWNACLDAVKKVVGDELVPVEFIHQLELENLIILSLDENENIIVRLGYQRFGDTLRATNLVEDFKKGLFDFKSFGARLQDLIEEDIGVLDAVAAILPDLMSLEVTDERFELPQKIAYSSYVRSLIWRAKTSFDSETNTRMSNALKESSWQPVYEALFSLCLVPDHPLNAENWLSYYLSSQNLVDRDTYLSTAAYKSFDEFGAIRSVLNSTHKANLDLWPSESLSLAICSLGWYSSCSDRRVRDLASKGITRILVHSPELAGTAIGSFGNIDDDYVKESLSLAIYSACLLSEAKQSEFAQSLAVMVKYRWMDSPNVLIRENVHLLATTLAQRELAPPTLVASALSSHKHALPNPWPTIADAMPLFTIKSIPSNMRVIGSSMAPDFMRYQVETSISEFNLADARIENENIGAWIVTETLRMGYPGRGQKALNADLLIQSESGGGRGKEAFRERLGKKYYWIALHRLVGILADNVPAQETSFKKTKASQRLWSLDSRKADLTDFRDLTAPVSYPDEILAGPRYPFPPLAATMKSWVTTIDFTPHENCIIRRSNTAEEWIPLWLSARDNSRDTDDWEQPYLNVDISYGSIFIDKALAKNRLTDLTYFSDKAVSVSRGYLAEYPNGESFTQFTQEGHMDVGSDGFSVGVVTLLRGGDWEYDFSAAERGENLDVPAPDIVNKLNLKWDRQRGWNNNKGELCAFYATANKRQGFFIKRSDLNHYLNITNQHLLLSYFGSRGLIKNTGNSEQIDLRAYIHYQQTSSPKVAEQSPVKHNC